ncbi:MAG: DUF4105 domain-containing protein [Duncaniella sp.]|nr:DUF4105 domain-containing protein [Duncaniella sp.]
MTIILTSMTLPHAFIRTILLIAISLVPFLVSSQVTVVPDSTLKVSLITCRAGANIYELEGHTALRFFDPETGDDVTVNWGLFDFDAPNFVYRFVKGETDYCVGAAPTPLFLNAYARQGRKVVEQELNLTPAQAGRLRELVMENLRPENRVYRYNYVLDNCSTRPLRLIEQATGDTLTFEASMLPHEVTTTFRNAMRHYHTAYPWYQFGIDLALGSGIDRPITTGEAAFAPESLELMMTSALLPDGEKAVKSTSVLINGTPGGGPLPATPWWLTPMFWCSIVALISLLLTIKQLRSGRFTGTTATRIFDTAFYGIFGLTGLVLTFLIFVSVHEATSPNWLYLWLNPLCFTAAITVCVKSAKQLLFSYQIVNFALLIVLVVIFLCGIQSPNPAFYPLIVADALRAIAYILTYRTNNHHHNA